MPNGNTLICDGSNGRFFEVTKNNEVVWKYVNPYQKMLDETNGGDVFRAYRVAPDDILQFKNLSPAKGMPVIPPDNATFKVN